MNSVALDMACDFLIRQKGRLYFLITCVFEPMRSCGYSITDVDNIVQLPEASCKPFAVCARSRPKTVTKKLSDLDLKNHKFEMCPRETDVGLT